MNAATLKAKIEDAKQRMLNAETQMETALRQVELAARENKSIISGALSTALAETKAARKELAELEKAIVEP